MKHTPMGYDIIGGRIVINEEEADKVKTMYAIYLIGGSYKAAAKAAGLDLTHGQVKHILQNSRYLGSDSFPAIIDQETFDAAEAERLRRAEEAGRDHLDKKPLPEAKYYTKFSVPEIPRKHLDPVKQTAYAYSLIKNLED